MRLTSYMTETGFSSLSVVECIVYVWNPKLGTPSPMIFPHKFGSHLSESYAVDSWVCMYGHPIFRQSSCAKKDTHELTATTSSLSSTRRWTRHAWATNTNEDGPSGYTSQYVIVIFTLAQKHFTLSQSTTKSLASSLLRKCKATIYSAWASRLLSS